MCVIVWFFFVFSVAVRGVYPRGECSSLFLFFCLFPSRCAYLSFLKMPSVVIVSLDRHLSQSQLLGDTNTLPPEREGWGVLRRRGW